MSNEQVHTLERRQESTQAPHHEVLGHLEKLREASHLPPLAGTPAELTRHSVESVPGLPPLAFSQEAPQGSRRLAAHEGPPDAHGGQTGVPESWT